MIDIISYLPGKRKHTASDWYSFNAVCCSDKRGRGGVKIGTDGWNYHCFNCGFTASFRLGYQLSIKAKKFLSWLNVDQHDIDLINLESLRCKSILDLAQPTQIVQQVDVTYETKVLPNSLVLLDSSEEHKALVEYIASRGFAIDDYPFMVDQAQSRLGILIPYFYRGQIVGTTTRFIDNRKPKYLSDQPPHFVFGVDFQQPDWNVAIVVEGILDAISIRGLGLLSNQISDEQVRILRKLNREIIVVPDQDKAGISIADRAVDLGFSVSMPMWDIDVKDVNDAVCKYGKLATLMSILECKESSRIKIELRRKQLVKEKNIT
jgi:hypothetical protein